MAGHSKWKNIQHRKGAQDAKRGKIFTKIGVELTVAARMGGGEPENNPRLRTALVKARTANMPKDIINRAIKKGTGELEGVEYVEKVYEGYGPGGVAVMVECLTDNGNRTVAEVRHAFNKHGGNLGTDGSVGWMFQRKGVFVYDAEKITDGDSFLELALENGADDVKDDSGQFEVITPPESFLSMKDALDSLKVDPEVSEITMIPDNTAAVQEDVGETLVKLINFLEDLDDVQNVHHNGDIPDSIL